MRVGLKVGLTMALIVVSMPVSAEVPTSLTCKVLGPCSLVEPGEDCIAIGTMPWDLHFDLSKRKVRSKPWKRSSQLGRLSAGHELSTGEYQFRVSWSAERNQDAIFSRDWTRMTFNPGPGSFACTPAN